MTKKNSRKSPLVPRQMNSAVCFPSSATNPFHLTVTSHTISKLEDLILEGDSLEVSLDETFHIGRILQVIGLECSKVSVDYSYCNVFICLNRRSNRLQNHRFWRWLTRKTKNGIMIQLETRQKRKRPRNGA